MNAPDPKRRIATASVVRAWLFYVIVICVFCRCDFYFFAIVISVFFLIIMSVFSNVTSVLFFCDFRFFDRDLCVLAL